MLGQWPAGGHHSRGTRWSGAEGHEQQEWGGGAKVKGKWCSRETRGFKWREQGAWREHQGEAQQIGDWRQKLFPAQCVKTKTKFYRESRHSDTSTGQQICLPFATFTGL